MDRRRLLRHVGVGAISGVAGCSFVDDGRETRSGEPPTASEETTERTGTTTPSASAFDAVLNAVEDLGCDSSGTTPCDATIQDAVADDTLLEFPPGEYLVERPLLLEEIDTLGIRGTGDRRDEVTFVHPKGYSRYFVNVRSGRNCLLENFTVDQTRDVVTNSGIAVLNRDGVTIRDVEIGGYSPTENGTYDLMCMVTAADGVGVVERFVTKGGAEVGTYPDAWPAFICGRPHRGTLKLVDCWFEECGSNGVYAGRTSGNVHIIGGLYKNSDVAQIRIGGAGSFVDGAKIVIDTADAENVRGDYEVVRGVWWESGELTKTGGTIRNCEFLDRMAPTRRGLIEVDGTAGAMTVRNCTFQSETDGVWAVAASPPGSSDMGGVPEKPWGVTLRNVDVTGWGSKGAAIQINGRPSSTIHNVSVTEKGTDRDGIVLVDSPGSRIEGTSVVVPRHPVLVETNDRPADCPLDVRGDSVFRTTDFEAGSGEAVAQRPAASRVCTREFGLDGRLIGISRRQGGPFVAWAIDDRPDDHIELHEDGSERWRASR